MQKTLLDFKCEPQIALAWAISAKNALQNHGRFSPNKLVFGHDFYINTPCILTDKLPALESTTLSGIIERNMEAMHKARQNFVQAESSEKIQRALRHKVRSYADVKYSDGDKVFYQRKHFEWWKEPGVVLGQDGQDGQFVLIRHGRAYYHVHPCQLMKEKVTSQAMQKQEHIKKCFCKGSCFSNGVDETEDGNVKLSKVMNRMIFSDSGNVPGHVESNLSECADNEDNTTQGVDSEKDVENNVVQGVTPLLIRHGRAYYHVHPCQLMKEKVTSQAMQKQEHIKKCFCKGSCFSNGVDEIEDGNVKLSKVMNRMIFSDSGNVPGHVESNLSECADNEDNTTQGVDSEKDVENNVVQGVTPENRTALKPKEIHLSSFSQWKVS